MWQGSLKHTRGAQSPTCGLVLGPGCSEPGRVSDRHAHACSFICASGRHLHICVKLHLYEQMELCAHVQMPTPHANGAACMWRSPAAHMELFPLLRQFTKPERLGTIALDTQMDRERTNNTHFAKCSPEL